MAETISQHVYERIEVMIARYKQAAGLDGRLNNLREQAAEVKAQYEQLAAEIAKLQAYEKEAFEALKTIATVVPDPEPNYLLSTLEARFGKLGQKAQEAMLKASAPKRGPGRPKGSGRSKHAIANRVPDWQTIMEVMSPQREMRIADIRQAVGYWGPVELLREEIKRIPGLVCLGNGYHSRYTLKEEM